MCVCACVVCVLWPMNITDLTSCTCWLTNQNRPLTHTDEDKIMPMNAPLSVRTVGFVRRNLSPSGRRVAPCVHLGARMPGRGRPATGIYRNWRPRPPKTLPVYCRGETLDQLAKQLPETQGWANTFRCRAGPQQQSNPLREGGPFSVYLPR